jgi:hypothetical protein
VIKIMAYEGTGDFGFLAPASPPEVTTPPHLKAEIQRLLSIAKNERYSTLTRRQACDKLRKEYGSFYMSTSYSEWLCGFSTDSDGSDSDSNGSDSDGSDGSDDSEQCPAKSSVPVASESNQPQFLLDEELDSKSKSNGEKASIEANADARAKTDAEAQVTSTKMHRD